MEVGIFTPIGNNGWLISENSPQYMPSFDLNKEIALRAESYGVDFLLPHREAAWVVMEERMRVLAELGTRCKEVCSPLHLPTLEKITGSLLDLADQLAEAR